MASSRLFFGHIRTSESNYQQVTLTAVSIKNNINGNPRYAVQVWIHHKFDGKETGNLWHPKVKGYRLTKADYYILNDVYDLAEDVTRFITDFEKAVQA